MPTNLMGLTALLGNQHKKTRGLLKAAGSVTASMNSVPMLCTPFICIFPVSFTDQGNIHLLLMKIAQQFLMLVKEYLHSNAISPICWMVCVLETRDLLFEFD